MLLTNDIIIIGESDHPSIKHRDSMTKHKYFNCRNRQLKQTSGWIIIDFMFEALAITPDHVSEW